ncbi:HAD family acid phosphatase [Planctobacterium marinum]|uniref:HAD family acid phosphatase n=1 Tax=Planctobacterium marinum TaxID=1631968 RepID=UPI001E429E4A|nr:HAD family acid phosphatase [Planctobacterium marinum]MCC2607037.1 endonuclease/exonuclease/phosphatase family protein [Planctobacterium marinum]
MNTMRLFGLASLLALTVGCTSNNALAMPEKADDVVQATDVTMPVRIATWNIEHLAYPQDTGCRPRTEQEIVALRHYAESLDADVIALQEVASATAMAQIFPDSDWRIIVSQRPDSESYECRGSGFTSTQQKVAFAVKKSVAVLATDNVEELALDMPGLRYGLVIQVASPNGPLDILNVHMKSGCFVDDYLSSDSESCQIYARQAPILDNWIAQREAQGTAYAVLGDFNHRMSAPYNRLSRLLFSENRSTRLATRDVIGCHPRYPAPIDHILVGGMNTQVASNSIQVHQFDNMEAEAMLSDHCAISTALFAEKPAYSTAVTWLTRSKEYQLLTEDMYRQATEAIKSVSSETSNWVVVMDVDETILDNSAYQRQTETLGTGFAPDTWNAWVESENAVLVPGAKAFMEAVYQQGGKVALITNRPRTLDAHTWRNLQALEVPVTNDNTCLMGRVAADKEVIGQPGIHNDKDLRRQQVRQGKAGCFSLTREINRSWAQPHQILFQVGDNIEDFAGVTQEHADIGALLPEHGRSLFLLPNPMYGSWR